MRSAEDIPLTVQDQLGRGSVLRDISASWKLEAELLLSAALGCSREFLLTHPDATLTNRQLEIFSIGLQRRSEGEPLSYILGKRAFWDFELIVDKRVLIPRPETEILVECAINALRGREAEELQLLDLGTGSGAIAFALAKHSPNWQVTAIDVSDEALQVARQNQALLGVFNLKLIQSNWYRNLPATKFDLIVSNPPYIVPDDPHLQKDGLNYEPQLALVAIENGLHYIKEIAIDAKEYLKPGAWLLLEHGFDQRERVNTLLSSLKYDDITGWQDLSGMDRVVAARWIGDPGKLPC